MRHSLPPLADLEKLDKRWKKKRRAIVKTGRLFAKQLGDYLAETADAQLAAYVEAMSFRGGARRRPRPIDPPPGTRLMDGDNLASGITSAITKNRHRKAT